MALSDLTSKIPSPIWSLLKRYWPLLLVIIIGFQFKYALSLRDRLNAKSNQLQLKDDELAKFRISDGNVRGAVRNPDGSIDHTSTFRPPEGTVEIVFREDPKTKKKIKELEAKLAAARSMGDDDSDEIKALEAELANARKGLFKPSVKVQRFGLTFRPGFGVIYSSKLYPEIDFKWAFWDRYSLKTGVTTKFVTTGLTRHIDDFTPSWFKLRNIEGQIVGGLNYTGGWRVGVGVRISG